MLHKLLTTFVVGVVLASCSSGEPQPLAPLWSLESPDGQTLNFEDHVAEKNHVILFWATWCPYCKALMPHLQSIIEEYGDGVEIVAISFRQDPGDRDPVDYIAEQGYEFTLLINGDKVARLYGAHGTPAVFIVDRDGRIVFNLYELPARPKESSMEGLKNSHKAARLAPYWAAQIRTTLDSLE